MTATTLVPPPATVDAAAPTPYRLTWLRTVRSEWVKLITTRSVLISLAAVVLVMVGLGAMAASVATGAISAPTPPGAPSGAGGPGAFSGQDPVTTVLTGANLAVLIVGVVGVLVGSREFTSGLIRTSLAAAPGRLRVLTAKVVAFLGMSVPAALVSVLAAFFVGMAVLGAGDAATVGLFDSGVLRAVLGTAAYLVGIGLIGIALGVLLRSTAGGIGVLVGGILIAPSLLQALLPESVSGTLKYLPSQAAGSFTSVTAGADSLSSGAGMAVFGAWVLGLLALAGVALRRRDV
ncbi:MAG: ABC transporter permease [Candidatus Nanopelagicales bacterium]